MKFKISLRYFEGPLFTRLILFLSIIGPGIISSSLDNDAGGITTYSLAGSQFGYAMLWIFIPMTVALAVIQEMGIRMGVVSGKGLASLIRERAGIRLTFFILFALTVVNFVNTLAEFSGISVSASIFGVPPFLSLPLAALFVWGFVVKGSYRSVEKVFLLASVLYVSYIISGLLTGPDWGTAGIRFCTTSNNRRYRVRHDDFSASGRHYHAMDAVLHSVISGRKGSFTTIPELRPARRNYWVRHYERRCFFYYSSMRFYNLCVRNSCQ